MKIDRNQLLVWGTLTVILALSFFIRIVGIGRSQSVDYHPDEWVLANPTYQIANQGQVGLKTHYKWPGCGAIYPVGYTLYVLKPAFGEYSYTAILRIFRVLSAIASVGTILVVFCFLRHYHSIRAGFLGAILLGISNLPVITGHYATLDSITMLIAAAAIFAAFRFFQRPPEDRQPSAIKSLLLGLLIGWGIAIKWTLLLCAIPFFVAFVSNFITAIRGHQINAFFSLSIRKSVPLVLGLMLGFLVFFPDIQLAPDKVKEGFDYEMKHHQTGHYGGILSDSGALGKRITRTYTNFKACGWTALAIAGLGSVVFVFFKKTSLKWFLFFIFLLWTYVPFKNLVSPPRHYLVPYMLLMILLAVALDTLLTHPKRPVRITTYILSACIMSVSLLYTCINVSTFWQEDPRVTCAEWIMNNVPKGSGVAWGPRHNSYNWAVPGMRIAPSLFQSFPRQAEPGKDQYFIISPKLKSVFKQHPPTRTIVPSEWFPAQPPTQQELQFYYEINQGGGPNLEQIKRFYSTPSFLGITLKVFGEYLHTSPTFAAQNVELYKVRTAPMSDNKP